MASVAAHQVSCQGCGTATTTSFQCPLCQAEGATDRGFFCTQECFAKNWMEHRNTLHKSGVVRERRPAPAEPVDAKTVAAAMDTSRKGKKRARDLAAAAERNNGDGEATTAAETATATAKCFAPWPALPSAAVCAEKGWATVTPALPLNVPRAVVRPAITTTNTTAAAAAETSPSKKKKNKSTRTSTSALPVEVEEKDYFWAAMLAAAQYAAASVLADPSRQVLVVAGDVYSAHGFAWACRCVGLTGMLQLAVTSTFARTATTTTQSNSNGDAASQDAHPPTPASLFTAHKRLVIATAAVVRASALRESRAATAVSGAAGLWLTAAPEHAVLITLPDVVDATDLQGVQTRAVFFTGPNGVGDEDEGNSGASVYTYSALEARYEDGAALQWTPVTMPAPGTSTTVAAESDEADGGEINTADTAAAAADVVADARQLSALHDPAARLDDDVCTCFANGDLAGALHRLVRLYQRQPGHFESTLFYVLCGNWGAAGLAHAHHRLAYIARFFADQSTRFAAKKNGTLVDAALRAIAAVVRLLPRMRDEEAEAAVAASEAAATATAANAKTGKHKSAKTESTVDASAASRSSTTAPPPLLLPTLASTTRVVLPLTTTAVSAPTTLEVARLANYFTYLPNLQLQATVCYLYAVASPAVLDTFALAWGLYRYLPGPSSLDAVEKVRSAAVLRVRQRYTTKLDPQQAAFYVVLMQLVYDAVGPFSLSVDELRRRLLWDLTLAHDAGSLEAFLHSCALLPNTEGMLLPTAKKQRARKADADAADTSSASATTLSSRQLLSQQGSKRETVQSRAALLRCFAVKTSAGADRNFGFVELPWKTFPITGERQRQVDRLHKTAVEEVLMAMPRVPKPMYVGDVGNLIGKWQHFNARFEGVLGATLQVFLEAHPDAFRVVDRLVTRRTAGNTEQVRIRFDGEDDANDNDSDDEGRGKRRGNDRRLLTGQKNGKDKANIELPARARKKRALKAFNKERFNRNYKSVNAEARVPGYVKRGPRRIKGRGKKVNKRVTKRGN